MNTGAPDSIKAQAGTHAVKTHICPKPQADEVQGLHSLQGHWCHQVSTTAPCIVSTGTPDRHADHLAAAAARQRAYHSSPAAALTAAYARCVQALGGVGAGGEGAPQCSPAVQLPELVVLTAARPHYNRRCVEHIPSEDIQTEAIEC